MTAAIAKFAAQKMLGKEMEKYRGKKPVGSEDPFFTTVKLPNGKTKKVKKQIPDFIPEHDAKVLAAAKSRAYHLDMSLFSLFGLRFGWSSVIGLIPELGDAIDCFMAYKLFKKCQRIEGGLDSKTKSKMVSNITIDFFIGLIPFVGDLMDAGFRCNTKNVALLENFLINKYDPARPRQKTESRAEKRRRLKLARRSRLEPFEDDPDKTQLNAVESVDDESEHDYLPESPPEVPPKDPQRGGYFNKRERQPDIERGTVQAGQH